MGKIPPEATVGGHCYVIFSYIVVHSRAVQTCLKVNTSSFDYVCWIRKYIDIYNPNSGNVGTFFKFE